MYIQDEEIIMWVNELGTTNPASKILDTFCDIFLDTISQWGGGFSDKTLIQMDNILHTAVREIKKIENVK